MRLFVGLRLSVARHCSPKFSQLSPTRVLKAHGFTPGETTGKTRSKKPKEQMK
jgi:hypothetical protein